METTGKVEKESQAGMPAPVGKLPVGKLPVGKLPRDILEFQPDVVELEHSPVPLGARWTLRAVFAFLIIAVLWSYLSHVDRVVTARGRIITTDTRIQVQPLVNSVVKMIHVRVGEKIKKGQLLATLDPTLTAADLIDAKQQIAVLRSQVRRLEAELSNQEYEPEEDEDARIAAIHKDIFLQRREEYQAKKEQFSQNIAGLRQSLKGNIQQQKNLQSRLQLAKDVESVYGKLKETSHVSRLEYLQHKERQLAVSSELDELQYREREIRHQLGGALSEQQAFSAQRRREVSGELNNIRMRYLSLQQQQEKAAQLHELVTLRSPANGVVLDVGQFSEGAIARAAEPLVSLMPADSELAVEVKVMAKDIGRIRTGDVTRIKLDAFPFQRHGLLPGEVSMISEDAFQTRETQGGAAEPLFYRTRIRILESELKDVPASYRLMAGMEVTAEIKVGNRRIIEYLVYPVIRAMGESMREP